MKLPGRKFCRRVCWGIAEIAGKLQGQNENKMELFFHIDKERKTGREIS
jgi:hypothetical protein